MMVLGFSTIAPVYGQDDGRGIDAPAEYWLDIIHLPNTHPTAFAIHYEFDGVNAETDEAVNLLLASSVTIQPETTRFYASLTAEGYLPLFNLVPRAAVDQTMLTSELAYLQKGSYALVHLPDSDQSSCGKQTLAPNAATIKLDEQLPFPTDIFFDNTLPAISRIYPDGDFAGKPTARYAAELDERIVQGQLEVEILPETKELIAFRFAGTGIFQADGGDITLDGNLIYEYSRTIPSENQMIARPAGCENPNVQGIPIFEPSVQWVVRADIGEYTTNQSIEKLIAYYAEQLPPQGFEFVEQTPVEFGHAMVTYIASTGDEVRIGFIDQVDGGVEVNIQLLPAFISS